MTYRNAMRRGFYEEVEYPVTGESIPGFMHTLLRVTGVLSGVESSVVLGLGFAVGGV